MIAAFKRLNARVQDDFDAIFFVQAGNSRSDNFWNGTAKNARRAFQNCHIAFLLARCRSSFQTNKATANNDDSCAGCQGFAQFSTVIQGSDNMNARQVCAW